MQPGMQTGGEAAASSTFAPAVPAPPAPAPSAPVPAPAPASTTLYARIDGICCENCIGIITHALMDLPGVDHVSIAGNIAEITGPCLPDVPTIVEAVRRAGYETSDAAISHRRRDVSSHIRWYEFAGIAVAIVAIGFLVKQAFGYNIFNAIPVIDTTMTYGMLFVTGLLTGIHCMSMCGAIGLVASTQMGGARSLKQPLLYNGGRVLSYTVIGAVVGAVGSVLSISPTVRAIIILVAAALMLAMALSMLGLFRIKLPRLSMPKPSGRSAGSFVVGLANGLMPCGPLQAMQLYALSTGSAASGALSMFLFALGTVPLMLVSGAVINLSRGKAKRIIGKVASVLILILSLTMLNRGLLALGVDVTALFDSAANSGTSGASSDAAEDAGYTPAIIHGSTQVVTLELDYDSYGDMVVQVGIPVTVILHVDESKLTGCNNQVICPEFGFDVSLVPGDNVFTFTPEAAGTYVFTCWMDMIHNRILVVDDPARFAHAAD